jgi:hypothetical protein
VKKVALLLGICAFSGTALSVPPSPVSVRVELPRSRVLPGVPFDIVVHVKNESEKPTAVGAWTMLTITPAGRVGVPFRRAQRLDDLDFEDHDPKNLYLAPHAEGTAAIPWDGWMDLDSETSGPGDYDVIVDVLPAVDADEGYAATETLHSFPARLTRVVGSDDDTGVWRRMQESGRGRLASYQLGFIDGLANEVMQKHPTSEYVPYALILTGGPHGYADETLDAFDAMIERFRDSPVYAELLVAAGVKANSDGQKARSHGRDPLEVERYLKLAVSYDERALQTGNAAVHNRAAANKRRAEADLQRLDHR